MKTEEQLLASDLRGTDIFAGLPDASLGLIAESCQQRVCQAGEYSAIQGEAIDRLLIVNGGRVAVEMRVSVPPHTHTVKVTTLSKGNVCAWSALVPPHVLTASIKSTETTPMLSIAASDLQRVFAEEPSIELIVMRNLAGVISSRLRDSHTQLVRLIAEVIKQGK